MKKIVSKHWNFWRDRTVIFSVLISLTLLIASAFVTYFASQYTDKYSNYIVPDLILDHIPLVDVSYLFFHGVFALLVILIFVAIFEPKYIPFTMGGSAAFFFTRSLFMIMTHLSAPSIAQYAYIDHESNSSDILFTLNSGNDLFFSGHAGYPFLLALIFWNVKPLRYLFLMFSLAGAVIVLLGHLHYSIDVFSAYFITYGVFEISKSFFKKEYSLIAEK